MMWPKPSLLSQDGEAGQEVLYSEEQLGGEQTHSRAWKTERTQTPSGPVMTRWREEHRGRGGGTVCEGRWKLAPFGLLPTLFRGVNVHTCPEYEVGANKQKSRDTEEGVSKSVSCLTTNHSPVHIPSFPP